MATAIKYVLLLLAMNVSVYKINAATLQRSEAYDLEEPVKTDDNSPAAPSKAEEESHLTVNQSKVIIDIFKPRSQQANRNEAENGQPSEPIAPFAQLVINSQKPIDDDDTKDDNKTEIQNDQPDSNVHNGNQLIPPASVNASIAQLAENKQKQGQIIIRYAFPRSQFISRHVVLIRSDYRIINHRLS